MYKKDKFGIYPSMPGDHISLLRYSKSACGVDFLLNTADNSERRSWFDTHKNYKTDFFEFFFFRKANGHAIINGEKHILTDNTLLIVSPYQRQEWHTDIERLDYTFLIFQEEFLTNFISDKQFMYRLLYCYQNEHPTYFQMPESDISLFISMLGQIKHELRNPIADSYHMIVAELYEFLLRLNRYYAKHFGLSMRLPVNNFAFVYKELLERNIRNSQRVNDYAAMMGISRIALNKAVENEFGVTAVQLLKQRLLQEVKNDLLFSGLPAKEIAARLGFSAPNHLMRFFKQQTGKTISTYLREMDKEGFS